MAPSTTILQKSVTKSYQRASSRPVTIAEPKTFVKQPIQQNQSFEIVQTLLLVSIASLCYLRNLLPTHCFADRDLEAIKSDVHWPFRSFSSESDPPKDILKEDSQNSGSPRSDKPRQLKVLARGRSEKSDKVLRWLDAIYESLRQGYLDSVQLSVFLDRDRPDEVVESYTFSFGYSSSNTSQIDGVLFSDLHGNTVTIRNARQGLNVIVRHLVQISQTLPYLPDTKFLTVHLFYTPNCPDSYQPVGFCNSESDEMKVPDSSDWKMLETNLGKMDAGYHNISVKVAYLRPVQELQIESDEEVFIPMDLNFSRSIPRRSTRLTALQTHQAEDEHSPAYKHNRKASSANKNNRLMDDIDEIPGIKSSNWVPTQESAATEKSLRDKLHEMVKIPSQRRDLEPTQPVTNNKLLEIQYGCDLGRLTPTTEERLDRKRSLYLSKRIEGLPDIDRCECDYNQEEGDMIRCDCCDNWQHRHCYGLDLVTITNQYIHVCYTCLLGDFEASILKSMRNTAKIRRVFWHLRKATDYKTDGDFSREIGCDVKGFQSAVNHLRKLGLLMHTSGSKNTGFAKKGISRFMVLEDKMKEDFDSHGTLHPHFGIGHHYQGSGGEGTADAETLDISNGVEHHDHEASSTEDETDELIAVRKPLVGDFYPQMPPPSTSKVRGELSTSAPLTPRSRARDEDCGFERRKRIKSSNACSPLNGCEEEP